MDCTKAGELMMRFMDHMLTDEEAKELGLHMDVCPACKEDFLVYDIIMTGFEELPIVSAPEGFEETVMQQIAELPQEEAASRMLNGIEHIVYAICGSFLVLAGIAFLIVMNKDAIVISLFGSEHFHTVTNALASFSASVGGFFTNIAFVLQSSLTEATVFLESARFVLLGILAILVAVGFVISNRSERKNKVEI